MAFGREGVSEDDVVEQVFLAFPLIVEPRKPEIIAQFARTHLLLDAIANWLPRASAVEAFVLAIEGKDSFAGAGVVEQSTFMGLDFGDVVVGVMAAEDVESGR